MSAASRLATPRLDHLTARDFEFVYEPCEDTFLLLDSLERDSDFLRSLRPALCLEVGPGSGCVSTFLGQLLKQQATPSLLFAVDINPLAALAARQTARHNGVQLNVLVGDLLTCFASPAAPAVDLVLFNPPYVPTDTDEMQDAYRLALHSQACQQDDRLTGLLTLAWAGGEDGRAVLDRFLDQLFAMKANGRAIRCVYLLLLEQNKPQEIEQLFEQHGYACTRLLTRRAANELLHTYRFVLATA